MATQLFLEESKNFVSSGEGSHICDILAESLAGCCFNLEKLCEVELKSKGLISLVEEIPK